MTTRTAVRAAFAQQTALDYLSGSRLLTTAMDMFLADCRSKQLSWHTTKFYADYLRRFADYAKSQAVSEIHQIDPAILRSYLLAFAQDHNPGGVHAAFRTLRAFLRWCEKEEIASPKWRNPIEKLDPPRVPQRILEPIGLEDVAALLETCRGRDFFNRRDRALLLCLLDSGLRATELCNLDLTDVDLASGRAAVRQGKGGKDRIIFVGPTTMRAIRAYLNVRPDKSSPALFIGRDLQRLTYDGVRHLLKRRCKRAGLAKQCAPHDFRRAFALNMLRNGADLYALQRLMGHADIQVLRRYLALNVEDLRAVHARSSPVEQHQWR